MEEKKPKISSLEHSPMSVRTLAELARVSNNAPVRKRAIAELVARRFLTTSNQTDDDLQGIENMTDGQIDAVLRGASR